MRRTEPDTLLPVHEKLIAAMLVYPTLIEAAESIGISRRSATRYFALPHVQAAYYAAQQDVNSSVRAQIEGLSTTAIKALKDILTSNSYMAKVQGVKIVLDRLDPETLKVPAQPTEQNTGPIPAELLPFVNEDELAQIDAILARAQARRNEQAASTSVS